MQRLWVSFWSRKNHSPSVSKFRAYITHPAARSLSEMDVKSSQRFVRNAWTTFGPNHTGTDWVISDFLTSYMILNTLRLHHLDRKIKFLFLHQKLKLNINGLTLIAHSENKNTKVIWTLITSTNNIYKHITKEEDQWFPSRQFPCSFDPTES